MSHTEGARHGGARILVALAIATALLNSTAPSPLYPLYRDAWGIDALTLTAVFAVYSLGTLGALLVLGRLSDRIGDRRRVIVPGLLVVAVGALVFAAADGVAWLLCGRLLAGIGTGTLTGAANAALAELDPAHDERRAAVIGAVALTAGCTFGPVLSVVALQAGAWPPAVPFAVIAAAAVAGAAAIAGMRWPPPCRAAAPPAAAPGRRTAILLLPGFRLAAAGLLLSWCVGAVFMALGTTIAHQVLGMQGAAAPGLTVAAFQLLGGVSQIWARAWESRRALALGATVLAAALAVVTAAAGLGATALFCAATLAAGFAYGITFVGAAGIASAAAPDDRRATAMSLFYLFGYLANLLPVMAFGAAADALGLFTALLGFTGIVGVAAASIVAQACRTRPRRDARCGRPAAVAGAGAHTPKECP
ncbi:MFS transporter [Azospirillum sp. ST 5-10]|uniref:MFS transporter n=1 Tax=unclassified Azospirillum TaxID=2630922 RepID=UPI003F49ED23